MPLHPCPPRLLPVIAACLLGAAGSFADPLAPPMRPGDVEAGRFLVRHDGSYRPAPLVETFVAIRVTGMVARTEVVQRFENPGDDWVEGIYVFPLPEGAAVDRLQMQIGPRFLEGEIREREEAKRVYERAKREGKKAALLEQERPNLFTSSVANLGPRETLFVRIEYQEELGYDQGRFELRFPMVVAPRYIPSRYIPEGFVGDRDDPPAADAILVPVPDAGRITPPVRPPASPRGPAPDPRRANPVFLDVEIDAGVALAEISSPSHAIRLEEMEGVVRVEFEEGFAPADADFVLAWEPELGAAPEAALFREALDGDTYALLMVMPPQPGDEQPPMPREVVFVIDTSGSMSGDSIQQAKEALLFALGRLQPRDLVNVIAFSSSPRALFPTSQSATRRIRERAEDFVHALTAGGGTEMASALRLALQDRGPSDAGEVRQVVFITDGAVGNETELFGILQRRLGRSRLFTVGIGSAPNAFFMNRAARFGRGTHAMIGSTSEVRDAMSALFAKLESPALTDLRIELADPDAELWPRRIPDLYRGEPVVVSMRVRDVRGGATLRGTSGGEPFELFLDLEAGQSRPGVHQLFARRKVAAAMDSLSAGADAVRVRSAVVELGLRHHLVTKYTSLVAVEERASAPRGIVLDPRVVPTLLPRGWRHSMVFRPPPTAPPSSVPPTVPGPEMRAAAAERRLAMRLPQTGTPAPLLLLVGLGLMLVGSALLKKARAVSPVRR